MTEQKGYRCLHLILAHLRRVVDHADHADHADYASALTVLKQITQFVPLLPHYYSERSSLDVNLAGRGLPNGLPQTMYVLSVERNRLWIRIVPLFMPPFPLYTRRQISGPRIFGKEDVSIRSAQHSNETVLTAVFPGSSFGCSLDVLSGD